jgi:hypothetical protein
MSSTGGSGSAERRIALRLALLAALAYLPFSHCHFSASDERGVFEPARSLVLRGNLAIGPGQHVFRGRDGRLYSHFAIGQTLLVLPLAAAGEAAARLVPENVLRVAIGREPDGNLDTQEDPAIFLASLYAPLATGALVGLFYAFERRLGVSRRGALLAAALLGGATYVAALSVFFLAHTTEALAILGALCALHAWRSGGRLRDLALGSALASSLVLIRVPALAAGPALAGYLLFGVAERLRSPPRPPLLRVAAAVLAPPLCVAAVHLAVNRAEWGTWIASPMLAQAPLLRGSLWHGLHGLLLSPGASLFVYSPLLLLLPFTLPGFWRVHRAECVAVLALAASFLLVCGRFLFWHGLWSAPGPRYLFALVPALMLPLGAWLDGARSRAARAGVAALALGGLGVQLVLMSVHWRRAVERMGYQNETAHFEFLFDPLRAPIVGCARALFAGDVDVYLWALARGVPGRDPAPLLAAALLLGWLALFALCAARLRAALAAAGADD